jgi:hypothetical protein
VPGTDAVTTASNQRALGQATEALARVLGAIGVGGKEGLADVGVELRNAVVRILSTPGTGRVYRRRGVLHRASAPGAPPAVDTGKYRSSWTYAVGEDVQGPYVDIGTNDIRGPMFEYGTRRMRPRPHARVAANEVRSKITQAIRDGIVAEQRSVVGRLPKEIR